jgi:hypothetical protein
MELELFRQEQKEREEKWAKKKAEIFRRVNSVPVDKIPQRIEELEEQATEEYRQKEKAKEYDKYHLAEEHVANIGNIEYEQRALNRRLGIQSFDIGIDFEFEGKEWVVTSCCEYGYDCSAYPKEQEDREYNERETSYFEIKEGKIVKR